MFNERKSVGSKPREASPFRNSLGNITARNNADEVNNRRAYFMSSTYFLYYKVKIARMFQIG